MRSFPALAAGSATVTVTSSAGKSVNAPIQIASVSPSIFTVGYDGIGAAYAVLVNPDNTQTFEPVFSDQAGIITAAPVAVNTGSGAAWNRL
jgi:uncharacterized protein (TIGR03437 family)